jgi:1-pyrroline-5-carboxylate dehydrogenase
VEFKIDVPLYRNEEVRTGDTKTMSAHDHKHIVGTYHQAQNHILKTRLQPHFKLKRLWANMAWEQRAFLKAAELLAGPYRAKINAATMIAQSKTVYQAEIDFL